MQTLDQYGQVDAMEAQIGTHAPRWSSLSARLIDVEGRLAHLLWGFDISTHKALEAQLRELATRDALSGLLNRRAFMERSTALFDHCRRHGQPCTVLMIDIDHFKRINDQHGHQMGDTAIRACADAIGQALREADLLGRLGARNLPRSCPTPVPTAPARWPSASGAPSRGWGWCRHPGIRSRSPSPSAWLPASATTRASNLCWPMPTRRCTAPRPPAATGCWPTGRPSRPLIPTHDTTTMSLRLLIVDDSRMSRLILQGLVLQAHPDWTIVHASSGEEALQQVRESPVDLVSMDFNMHGMNGLEAALALRQLLPQVPIAILTANVQTAVQERIEEAGMVFIAKPITAQAAQQLAALAGA